MLAADNERKYVQIIKKIKKGDGKTKGNVYFGALPERGKGELKTNSCNNYAQQSPCKIVQF